MSIFPENPNALRNPTLKLLYRGSRQGINSSDSHCKCDGYSGTIILIQTTNDLIFRSSRPLACNSTSCPKVDSSHRSFVFTIVHNFDFGPRTFAFKPDHLQYGLVWSASHGLSSGNGTVPCVGTNCVSSHSIYPALNGRVTDTRLNNYLVLTGREYVTGTGLKSLNWLRKSNDFTSERVLSN
jgi:hypothetical protein